MPKASLAQIVRYCDRLLATDQFADWDGACNGLQVQNNGSVSRIAAAVDASLSTVQMAIAEQVDLLLVHHGLFWGRTHPWTGRRYELLQALLGNNLAVYSSHLPLDAHRTLGNNAQLCAKLGLNRLKPFFIAKGRSIGFQAETALPRDRFIELVTSAIGKPPTVLPGGPELCRRIGVVSGGGGDELAQAAAEGVDTFLTGEGKHWTYALAEDLGLNVLYAGHYATETFGVKALAAKLSKHCKVPWVFLDHPTGL